MATLIKKINGHDITQDKPEITLFKQIYQKHTPFGILSQDISSNSSIINFGSTITYTIPKTGDLLLDMYISVTLPPAAGKGGIFDDGSLYQDSDGNDLVTWSDGAVTNWKNYVYWVDCIGHALINKVSIEYQGIKIDEHSGLWLNIWNELTDEGQKESSLIGKRDEKNNTNYTSRINVKNNIVNIPLKFFFNRNSAFALPIFLLNDNSVKLNITFNELTNLVNYKQSTGTAINSDCKIKKVELIGSFAILTNIEKQDMINSSRKGELEYLVETISSTGNTSVNTTTFTKNIGLDDAIKEIIWVFRHNDRIAPGSIDKSMYNNYKKNDINSNDIFNYSLHEENANLNMGTKDPFSTLKISIDNDTVLDTKDAPFFRSIQPNNYHTNIPGKLNEKSKYIYSYSFGLNPEKPEPSGSYNFNVNDNDNLKFEFTGTNTDYQFSSFTVIYKQLKIINNNIEIKTLPFTSDLSDLDVKFLPSIEKAQKQLTNKQIIRKYNKKSSAYKNLIKQTLKDTSKC